MRAVKRDLAFGSLDLARDQGARLSFQSAPRQYCSLLRAGQPRLQLAQSSSNESSYSFMGTLARGPLCAPCPRVDMISDTSFSGHLVLFCARKLPLSLLALRWPFDPDQAVPRRAATRLKHATNGRCLRAADRRAAPPETRSAQISRFA